MTIIEIGDCKKRMVIRNLYIEGNECLLIMKATKEIDYQINSSLSRCIND
jgi:hypothetical protein